MLRTDREPETILRRKENYLRKVGNTFGDEVEEKVREDALDLVRQYTESHDPLPEEEAIHVEDNIVPTACIYMALKGQVGTAAITFIRRVKNSSSEESGRNLDSRLRDMGREAFFCWWVEYCRNIYGKANGFVSVHYPPEKQGATLDVLKCPYKEYLDELGCPELITAFCDSDNYSYGNLRGVRFIRKGTLGYGDNKCDFRLEAVNDQEK